MDTPRANADAVVQQIDAGTLRPMGNEVARKLLKMMSFQHEIISHYDNGEKLKPLNGDDPLWRKINALPSNRQGALRLLVNLTHDESEIDWYAAEFLILWARQEGLSEEDIGRAFGLDVNGS